MACPLSIASPRTNRSLLLDAAPAANGIFKAAPSPEVKGVCLERIPMLKDYWFDWRNYNPKTTIWETYKITCGDGLREVSPAPRRELALEPARTRTGFAILFRC